MYASKPDPGITPSDPLHTRGVLPPLQERTLRHGTVWRTMSLALWRCTLTCCWTLG